MEAQERGRGEQVWGGRRGKRGGRRESRSPHGVWRRRRERDCPQPGGAARVAGAVAERNRRAETRSRRAGRRLAGVTGATVAQCGTPLAERTGVRVAGCDDGGAVKTNAHAGRNGRRTKILLGRASGRCGPNVSDSDLCEGGVILTVRGGFGEKDSSKALRWSGRRLTLGGHAVFGHAFRTYNESGHRFSFVNVTAGPAGDRAARDQRGIRRSRGGRRSVRAADTAGHLP